MFEMLLTLLFQPAVIANFDSRAAKFFVAFSFMLATVGNQIAAGSYPFSNDVTGIAPKVSCILLFAFPPTIANTSSTSTYSEERSSSQFSALFLLLGTSLKTRPVCLPFCRATLASWGHSQASWLQITISSSNASSTFTRCIDPMASTGTLADSTGEHLQRSLPPLHLLCLVSQRVLPLRSMLVVPGRYTLSLGKS
jgi:hypothetical protein